MSGHPRGDEPHGARAGAAAGVAGFDAAAVRADFPLLAGSPDDRPLVYLDSAATAQKPRCVIERIERFYARENANIHRGVYRLSEVATAAYEAARVAVRDFIGAGDDSEIIFTRGATEGLNLLASCLGRVCVDEGDEIVVSQMEHHSNIVPWQILCEERGARLRVIPMNDRGELIMEEYEKLLGPRTRIVSVVHQSNALGTVNPVREIAALAREAGAVVVVDGAQAAAHLEVDVGDIGCDFYVFSGHKVFGPTGIGVLWGRREWLDRMPPYHGGGDMIRTVTFEKTTYADPPAKFEAGTPNIAGAVGLAEAIGYVSRLDRRAAAAHESWLLEYAASRLESVPGIRFIGTAAERASVLSFTLADAHPHDIGTILDQEGVAVRTGHHCAQPVMDFFEVPATVRASIAIYNTGDDIDALVRGLEVVTGIFQRPAGTD